MKKIHVLVLEEDCQRIDALKVGDESRSSVIHRLLDEKKAKKV